MVPKALCFWIVRLCVHTRKINTGLVAFYDLVFICNGLLCILCYNNNNNDRLTAFDPGQPG